MYISVVLAVSLESSVKPDMKNVKLIDVLCQMHSWCVIRHRNTCYHAGSQTPLLLHSVLGETFMLFANTELKNSKGFR